MKYLVITIFILLVLLVALTMILSYIVKKNRQLKKENESIRKQMNVIIKEKMQNEKDKEELHTGDSVADFNNSIALLQKHSTRSKT